jgi:hypothetical protein
MVAEGAAPIETDVAEDDEAGAVELPAETLDGEPVGPAPPPRADRGPKSQADRTARGLPLRPGAVTGEPLKEAPYIFFAEGDPTLQLVTYASSESAMVVVAAGLAAAPKQRGARGDRGMGGRVTGTRTSCRLTFRASCC